MYDISVIIVKPTKSIRIFICNPRHTHLTKSTLFPKSNPIYNNTDHSREFPRLFKDIHTFQVVAFQMAKDNKTNNYLYLSLNKDDLFYKRG